MKSTRSSVVKRVTVVVGIGAATLGLMSGTASAHITPLDPEGPSGGYMTTAFKVGHGCDEQATTKVEIKIPDGVTSVAPQPISGWELSTTTRKLDPPIDMEGTKITETTDTVVWDGGSLPADQLEMFWVSMKLPEGKPGDQLAFPIIQTCGSTSTNWIAIPKDGEPEPDHPAATITLTESTGDHHGSSADDSTDNGASEPGSPGATEPAVASNETAQTASTDGAGSGDSNNALTITALVLAIIGVGLGTAGLVRSNNRS